MIAEALNAMEGRIDGRLDRIDGRLDRIDGGIAGLKGDIAGLKGDIARLDSKIDASFRLMGQRMDEGFRQVVDHLNRR